MNSTGAHHRIASLVVVTTALTVPEINGIVGVAPDAFREIGTLRPGNSRSKPAKENSWELLERSDSSVPLPILIDRLLPRILPLQSQFVDLRNRGCFIKLELVQWVSAVNDAGVGFALDHGVINFMSAIGAALDVDQYVE